MLTSFLYREYSFCIHLSYTVSDIEFYPLTKSAVKIMQKRRESMYTTGQDEYSLLTSHFFAYKKNSYKCQQWHDAISRFRNIQKDKDDLISTLHYIFDDVNNISSGLQFNDANCLFFHPILFRNYESFSTSKFR